MAQTVRIMTHMLLTSTLCTVLHASQASTEARPPDTTAESLHSCSPLIALAWFQTHTMKYQYKSQLECRARQSSAGVADRSTAEKGGRRCRAPSVAPFGVCKERWRWSVRTHTRPSGQLLVTYRKDQMVEAVGVFNLQGE